MTSKRLASRIVKLMMVKVVVMCDGECDELLICVVNGTREDKQQNAIVRCARKRKAEAGP